MRRALIFALLFACSEGEHRFDDVRVTCTYNDQAVGWHDPAPNGVVPAELLAAAEGTWAARGVWTDDSREVQVDLTLERRGDSAIYRENTGGGCGSYLAMDVALSLSTDDGAFAESFEAQAVDAALGEPALAVGHTLPTSELQGSYRPVVANGEVQGIRIDLTFRAAGPSGRIAVRSEGVDGDVAWSADDDVLEISPPRS